MVRKIWFIILESVKLVDSSLIFTDWTDPNADGDEYLKRILDWLGEQQFHRVTRLKLVRLDRSESLVCLLTTRLRRLASGNLVIIREGRTRLKTIRLLGACSGTYAPKLSVRGRPRMIIKTWPQSMSSWIATKYSPTGTIATCYVMYEHEISKAEPRWTTSTTVVSYTIDELLITTAHDYKSSFFFFLTVLKIEGWNVESTSYYIRFSSNQTDAHVFYGL